MTLNNAIEDFKGYLGNTLIKRSGVPVQWSEERIREYQKCANDPMYFAEKYIQIVHVDRGLIPIDLYDYQEEIIDKYNNSRRVAVVTSRQAGKCVFINTSIRVRNKITGEVIETTIGDFYEMQKKAR